jgi:phospholipid/cholesterol/gamma-HCH transport system substrate-binding protein
MDKKQVEWKVGLFVLIGLVLLAALLLQFSKGTSFFRSTYSLYLTARNVGGLKERASVLMAGVQIGTVSSIRLNPGSTNVTITLRLYSEYPIRKNARFVIEQSGFLGDQYVAITPGPAQGPPFAPGDHAEAQEPFNLQEVARSAQGFIQRIDETARRLNESLNDVRRLVLNPETLTNVAQATVNLRRVTEQALDTVNDFNALIVSNTPAVSTSASNLLQFSAEMQDFADSLNGMLATNAPAVASAVSNIDSSTAALKSILDNAQAGNGLVGTLMRNEQMASNVVDIVNNLAVTTSNLNRLGLWGILWSHKPPHTNTGPTRPLTAPKNPFR